MNASEIIADFEAAGILLWEDAGQLRFRASKGVLTDEKRELLVLNKQAVLVALRIPRSPLVVADDAHSNESFPLTDVQSAYLLGRSGAFGFGGVACHMYVELEFDELDPGRLEHAWNVLVRRHDMLRAVIGEDGAQRVLSEVPRYDVPSFDLRAASAELIESTLVDIRAELGHRIHATDQWPLFELRTSLTNRVSLLHLSIDFIVADWSSVQLLLAELMAVYQERLNELPPLRVRFRDYVLAERALHETSRFIRDREYWQARVDALPAAPDLPIVSNAAHSSGRFQRFSFELGRAAWESLQRAASGREVTASVAVLAAFAEVIGVWSRKPAFTLNLTLLNRLPLHPDIDRIVGDFTSVNLLSIATDVGETFTARARALALRLFDDLDHRLYSGVAVLRELGRRRGRDAALLPIVFTSAIGSEGRASSEHRDAPRIGYGITQTPQVWVDCQAMDHRGALRINWDFREGVFPAGVLEQMFAAFTALLTELSASDEAWRAKSPVSLPRSQLERRRSVNADSAPASSALLHHAFERHAQLTPARLALITPGRSLSYGELWQSAATLASRLVGAGCGPRDRVAVIMNKGWEQVVSVLAVLMVGAAYLPIDTNQPQARQEKLLIDGAVRFALTQPGVLVPASVRDLSVLTVHESEVEAPGLRLKASGIGADDLAYVIYTSGSTGIPKGVMMSHRGALNTIEDVNRRFEVTADDRVFGLANLGFDLSVYDIFGPLSVGACLVLPDAARRSEPEHWSELIQAHGISVWNSVPAQIQMLEHFLASDLTVQLPSLRLGLLSGDWIPVGLPAQLQRRLPGLALVSLGGATEAAIWSIYHRIGLVLPDWRSIPYGKPLANQQFHVLGDALQPRPDWVAGELYIGGTGLASGYWGDEARSLARFIVHPETHQRLYRTGDLGRYLPSGEIEFLGREDGQVKVRGHRIELGEVEATLQSHLAVREAVVVAQGEAQSSRRLVAFVVRRDERSLDEFDTIQAHLAAQLPDYMWPVSIQALSALPLSDNGKIDRSALLKLADAATRIEQEVDEPPRGDLERRLAVVWSEVLGVPQLSRNRNFFEAGGDSLLAAKLAARIRERITEARGLFFDSLVRQLLPTPTIAGLAAHLQKAAPAAAPDTNTVPASPLLDLNHGESGMPLTVLIHDAAGKLGRLRPLASLLAAHHRVVGLAVNVAEPYLRMDAEHMLQRRASTYRRLIQARAPKRLQLIAFGVSAALGLEVARQLMESGVDIGQLVFLDGSFVARKLDELELERLETVETGPDWNSPAFDWPEVDVIHDPTVLRSVFRHTLRASAAHESSPYIGDITVVRSKQSLSVAVGQSDDDMWRKVCLGAVRVVPLLEVDTSNLLSRATDVLELILEADGEKR
jgi:pyochelin synthetase